MTVTRLAPATVLGPQGSEISVAEAVGHLAASGPVATITAGWQEHEDEDGELQAALGGRGANLRLYQRWEKVAAEDPDLAGAHHRLQTRLRELRRLYNRRLDHAMGSWRDVMEWRGDKSLARPEAEHALEAIRALDRHHLDRVAALRVEFAETTRPAEHPAVAREIADIERIVADSGAVCVAGGHVAVLLNRMRVFQLGRILATVPVVAWSAGAMALSDQVVLFHDSPPWGPGHAEAFETGMGRLPGIVPFPHADERLHLQDRGRVARLARRFAPRRCVVLASGSSLRFDGKRWTATPAERVLQASGGVQERARW